MVALGQPQSYQLRKVSVMDLSGLVWPFSRLIFHPHRASSIWGRLKESKPSVGSTHLGAIMPGCKPGTDSS